MDNLHGSGVQGMREVLGMSQDEVCEIDIPPVVSVKEVFTVPGVTVRDIRLAAGMMVGPRDLDEGRRQLARNRPDWLEPPK